MKRLVLAYAVLALGVLGCLLIRDSLGLACALFLVGGLGVAGLAEFGAGLGTVPGPAIPASRSPRTREFAGVAALFLFSLAVRLYRLDQYPAGPGLLESALGLACEKLNGSRYAAFADAAGVKFPSLVLYQGLAAAKILGWKFQAFRVPAALWGTLSVVAFYFLLRQFCSALAAGMFALLYSVNNLHLTQSRLFCPGALLFFTLAASAAFMVMGIGRGGRWRFCAAGAVCGLSVYGTATGLVLPPLFILSLFWRSWVGRKKRGAFHAIPDILYFSAACLVTAAPALWQYAAIPGLGWQSTHFVAGGNFWGAARAMITRIPQYIRVFYTIPDGNTETTLGLALFPVLRPDILTQVFFPMGLVASVCMLRRPLPSLLLAGLVFGIAPAVADTASVHPNTGLAFLALPWVYCAAALAWDQVAQAFRGMVAPARHVFLGMSLMLAFLAVPWSLHQYFVSIMALPSMRTAYCAYAGDIAADLDRFPGSAVKVSSELAEPAKLSAGGTLDDASRNPDRFPDYLMVDWPKDVPVTGIKQFEDFLVMRSPGPQLLLMAPYLAASIPLLQVLFPNSQAYIYGSGGAGETLSPSWDLYEADVQLVRCRIPPKDVNAFTGMVDLFQPPYAEGSRLDVWRPDTLESRRGLNEDLGAVVVVQKAGAPLRFHMGWKGWTLKVDGSRRDWEREQSLSPGAHRVEISGRVPLWGSVILPFSIACAGKDVLGEGQLLPLDPRPGLQADLFPDAAGTRQSRFEILPLHRFSRPEGVLPPFHAEFRSRLRVPEAGRFAFRVRPPGQGSVRVGGRVAFDSGAGPAAVQPWFDLTPGQGQSLAVEVAIDSRTGRLPTMILEYCGQDSSTWKVLPYGWLDLDGGH